MRNSLFGLVLTSVLALNGVAHAQRQSFCLRPRPVAAQADCSPRVVPGKHGTLNTYRVPFNGDGHGNGISQSIWVNFRMFDDGRIEAPLKYDNDSKEAFCGGVHIRLGDINNNSIAEFYSDPTECVNG